MMMVCQCLFKLEFFTRLMCVLKVESGKGSLVVQRLKMMKGVDLLC